MLLDPLSRPQASKSNFVALLGLGDKNSLVFLAEKMGDGLSLDLPLLYRSATWSAPVLRWFWLASKVHLLVGGGVGDRSLPCYSITVHLDLALETALGLGPPRASSSSYSLSAILSGEAHLSHAATGAFTEAAASDHFRNPAERCIHAARDGATEGSLRE